MYFKSESATWKGGRSSYSGSETTANEKLLAFPLMAICLSPS